MTSFSFEKNNNNLFRTFRRPFSRVNRNYEYDNDRTHKFPSREVVDHFSLTTNGAHGGGGRGAIRDAECKWVQNWLR